jgi:hypothetical protein
MSGCEDILCVMFRRRGRHRFAPLCNAKAPASRSSAPRRPAGAQAPDPGAYAPQRGPVRARRPVGPDYCKLPRCELSRLPMHSALASYSSSQARARGPWPVATRGQVRTSGPRPGPVGPQLRSCAALDRQCASTSALQNVRRIKGFDRLNNLGHSPGRLVSRGATSDRRRRHDACGRPECSRGTRVAHHVPMRDQHSRRSLMHHACLSWAAEAGSSARPVRASVLRDGIPLRATEPAGTLVFQSQARAR